LARGLHIYLCLLSSTMLWRRLLAFSVGRRRGGCGGGSGLFSALALGLAHDFYVGPDFVESRCDLRSSGCDAPIDHFSCLVEAFVEVELGHLGGEPALYVFDCKTAGAGMSRLDDVEEVKVSEALPKFVVLGLLPCVPERRCELYRWVTLDISKQSFWVPSILLADVLMVFFGCEEGEEVFLEL
jgi:hypothetical protein